MDKTKWQQANSICLEEIFLAPRRTKFHVPWNSINWNLPLYSSRNWYSVYQTVFSWTACSYWSGKNTKKFNFIYTKFEPPAYKIHSLDLFKSSSINTVLFK